MPDFVDDKQCNGVIVPIYFPPDGEEPQFIMFRAGTGKKAGKIEFLGGSREETDETAMDTAIREAYEESCGMVNLTKNDLLHSPIRKVWSSFMFYVKVPEMKDVDFQNYIAVYKKINAKPDCHFLEMDKLVRVRVSEFFNDENEPIYPSKKEIHHVRDVAGDVYPVWQLSVLAVYHAIKNDMNILLRTKKGTIKSIKKHCIFDDDSD